MEENIHKIPKRKNFFEAFYSRISRFLSKYIVKTNFTPNQITLVSGLFGIVGAFLLTSKVSTGLILAGVCIQLFTILDLVDGDIARMKNMCSSFGKSLDIFFDKLNDFLLILGLSLGVYIRTGKIHALYLGMVLMGLVFFIQFSMVSNSLIFKGFEKEKKDDTEIKTALSINKRKFLKKLITFIGRHFLLEHCAFLFLISFFTFINELYIGLWFITLHALLTKVFMTTLSFYKLKEAEK